MCLHGGDAGLAHEALELALVSGVDLGAKHSDEHERAPSGMSEISSFPAAPSRVQPGGRLFVGDRNDGRPGDAGAAADGGMQSGRTRW